MSMATVEQAVTDAPSTPAPGDRLANGAVVLAARRTNVERTGAEHGVVLARHYGEHVTWRWSKHPTNELATWAGHYFGDPAFHESDETLREAVSDYFERVEGLS